MSDGELFHYTTAQGLKGILTEQNLRASHYRHLNDDSEMKILKTSIIHFFAQELLKLINSDNARFGSMDQPRQQLYAEDEAKNLFESAMKAGDQLLPIFVTSLCKHEESDQREHGLLSQWRAYGSNAGYCIVFDEIKFCSMLDELQTNDHLVHRPVKYPRENDSPPFDSLIGTATALFKKKFNRYVNNGMLHLPNNAKIPYPDTSPDQNGLDDPVNTLMKAYASILPFHKHYGFAEEREYRIALAVKSKGFVDGKQLATGIEFDIRHDEILPFVKLFKLGSKLPILRILVGPGGKQQRRKHGVEQFLLSLGSDCEVVCSDIPFV